MNRLLLKELNHRPISYYPIYRRITGSTTAGILLSQLMYWFSKKDKIYKTDSDIHEETLLTKKELENAKKLIKKLEFIEVTREGIPAKTFYKIDWKKYETCLNELGKQDSTKGGNSTPLSSHNKIPPKGETNIVKTKAENTTKNTTKTTTPFSPSRRKVGNRLSNEKIEYLDFIKQARKIYKPIPEKNFFPQIIRIQRDDGSIGYLQVDLNGYLYFKSSEKTEDIPASDAYNYWEFIFQNQDMIIPIERQQKKINKVEENYYGNT